MCGYPYCKKVPFTEDELKWTEPYAIGDSIQFVEPLNNSIDTLIITDKTTFNPSNTFILDPRGCKWWNGDHEFSAVTAIELSMLHDGHKYKGAFIIQKVCHKKPIMMSTYFMERLADSLYISEIKNNKLVSFVEIEDFTIRDSDFSKEVKPYSIPLHEIYWNRDKGLTGYKIGDKVYVLKSPLS